MKEDTATRTPIGAWRWLFVGLVALPLLWLSLAVSFAGVAARRQSQQALAWWPWSAEAAAYLGADLLSDPSASKARRAAALARRALARQPMSPIAARSLAIAAAYTDPTGGQTRRLMEYAEALSRRDVPTQLWLIEANVQRGNVQGALVHYDRVMRTSLDMRASILPVLTSATNDPAIARGVAGLLARGPSWRDDFVSRLVTQVDNPVSLATVLPAARLSAASPQDRNLIEQGLARIAERGAPDLAYRLYRTSGGRLPDARQAVVNGDLETEPGLAPFDWAMNADPALTTNREASEGGWRMHASMAAGARGWLARQMLSLRPGIYMLAARVSGPRSDGSGLTTSLRCLDGTTLFSQPWQGRDRVTGAIRVPATCHAAWLTFDGYGPLDSGPSDYWLGPVTVSLR